MRRGGIIGSSTAYYLTRHPKYTADVAIHVIEASGIAAGYIGLLLIMTLSDQLLAGLQERRVAFSRVTGTEAQQRNLQV